MNVCWRDECQTTAGCAHRGSRGEYCYFPDRQAARIEALERALRTIRLQNVEPYCREIARAALDRDE
jgi:hypothetical protein